MKFGFASLCVAFPLLTVACGDPPDRANPDPNCHPLGGETDCALPWPSTRFMTADATTATGYRVLLPETLLPIGPEGVHMSPARMNQRDGFSPASTLIAHFAGDVAKEQLPPETDPEQSLAATSTVQLLNATTGQRVLLFAELDGNAYNPLDRSLLIRPLVRLEPSTRYIVVVRNLRDTSGAPIVNQPFEALKRNQVTTPNLVAEVEKYREIFATIEQSGVAKSDLTLAWDFRTGSDEQVLANLLKMRDEALPAWESEKLGYDVEQTAESDDQLWFELKGTFDVPSYLVDDSDDAILQLDTNGLPVRRGTQKFPLVIHVPRCAETATAPLPIMVFGHGLFGQAESEMSSGYQKRVKQELCMVQIGTDWIGLSIADAAAALTVVIPDFTKFPRISDRLQQAQLNFLVLARLGARLLKDDPRLKVGDRAIVDGNEIYYYGISQGGIEGGTLLALSPDVQRGVLNVGAGVYSLMLLRSSNFTDFKFLLNSSYGTQREQQLLLSLTQSYWDYSDPVTFAPYVRKKPLPNLDGTKLPARPMILQEAIGDSQVPNLATRLMARTYELPLLIPSPQAVPQLATTGPNVDAAYVQWDIEPMPLQPPGNVPPEVDNQAHGRIRKIPQLVEQLRRFLKPGGKVEDTCGGACKFPGFVE